MRICPVRKPYPSDVFDDEWNFVAPYLTLMTPDAPQRKHDLRELFNGLRWLVRTGSPWRYLPNDLPPSESTEGARWQAVYQQTQRWIAAGCFEALVQDLRALLRVAQGRNAQPSAAVFDSRTLQSSPESGGRAGYDGYKRRKGSKVHMAVDTLGQQTRRVSRKGVAKTTNARVGGLPGERGGPGEGRGVGRGGAGGDGGERGSSIRRSGLHG